MAISTPNPTGISSSLKWMMISLFLSWTFIVILSLLWNVSDLHHTTDEIAKTTARNVYEMDVTYRKWNSLHGGVYVAIDSTTLPNPYLNSVRERDLTTPSGKNLTLINPAYMTRQVHELLATQSGTQGHITSLKPIRSENAPDPWETEALKSFESGKPEATIVEIYRDEEHIRLMKPLFVEESCLACHAVQGYKVGDVRGGISVAVPMKALRNLESARSGALMLAHLLLWSVGALGIGFMWRVLRSSEVKRNQVLMEREEIIINLNTALSKVKTLSGFIPICASCKKIRDDKGYWSQVEDYVRSHSHAEFSHGICPDCLKRLYPEYVTGLKPELHN